MADVSANLKDWSATASSNSPSGSTTIGTGLDDNLRQIQATIVQDLNSKGADIASATTTDLGAVAGLYHDITGTTTITGLGTVRAGVIKIIQFDGALTLTHNATSLILPGAANITTAAGDHALCMSLGSGNWVVLMYSRANGGPVSYTFTTDITMSGASIIEAEGAAVASAATTNIWATDGNTVHITGTTTITSFGTAPQAGAWMKVIFDGALTLTHGANLNLPGSANITTAAGDIAFVYADTTTQHDVLYFKADGTAIAGSVSAASQAQVDAGTANNVYIPPSLRKISLLATQAATSGTSKDFTIPAGAREIVINLRGVSTNGSSHYLIQLGDAGGIETSGYNSTAEHQQISVSSTAGFILTSNGDAANVWQGTIILRLVDAATFDWTSVGGIGNGNIISSSAGGKTLSQELTTVRITTVNGTDTFDAGLVGCSYTL